MTEEQWRARADAHTLALAEKIKQDPIRLNNAKQAARQMVDDEREDLKAMAKIAGRKTPENVTAKCIKDRITSNQTPNTTNKFNVFKRI